MGIQFDDTKYQELKTHLEKIRTARNLVSSENWRHKYDKNYSVAINKKSNISNQRIYIYIYI